MLPSFYLTLSLSTAAAFFAGPSAAAFWLAQFYSKTGCEGDKIGDRIEIDNPGCLTGPSGSVSFSSSGGGNEGDYYLLAQKLGCGCYTNAKHFDTWDLHDDESKRCIDLDGDMNSPSYSFHFATGTEVSDSKGEYPGDVPKCS